MHEFKLEKTNTLQIIEVNWTKLVCVGLMKRSCIIEFLSQDQNLHCFNGLK